MNDRSHLCTSGNVDWTVRAQYEVPNKSIDRTEPQSITLIFYVSAPTAVEAWEYALAAFEVEFRIKDKIFQRREIRCEIDT